jgi:hypothetical protein
VLAVQRPPAQGAPTARATTPKARAPRTPRATTPRGATARPATPAEPAPEAPPADRDSAIERLFAPLLESDRTEPLPRSSKPDRPVSDDRS